MKMLRGFALLFGLLIVGALMAPVPSEAAPTLLLSSTGDGYGGDIDITVPLSTGQACVPAEEAASLCYYITNDIYCPGSSLLLFNQPEPGVAAPLKVLVSWRANEWFVPGSSKTNPARLVASGTANCNANTNAWTIGNYSASNTARLIVTDNGSTALDTFKLTGITFTPGSAATGTKSLKVKYSNAFTANAQIGSYTMGLLIGGNYSAGANLTPSAVCPGPSPCNLNRGNTINYSGKGFFRISDATAQDIGSPLSNTVPATSILKTTGIAVNGSATMQSPTTSALPTFSNCNYPAGFCTPTIMETFTVTVTDRDTTALSSSSLFVGKFCPLVGEGLPDPCAAQATVDIRARLKKAARQEAKALTLASAHHHNCPVNKEGHEDEECDDVDTDPD